MAFAATRGCLTRLSNGAQLRQLFQSRAPVALVGCPNAMAGREMVRAGFEATYVSGYATALNSGLPDIGLLPREAVCRAVKEQHAATGRPVVADADTGFGEVEALRLTVHEYVGAGAAGFHIEDQVFPKRCGHLAGKQVVPTQDFVQKIKAATAARAVSGDPDFVIIARSDAYSVEGFDAMVARCRAYAEAGADALFPEATASLAEFKAFAEAMRGVRGPGGRAPLLVANMTEFGKTQRITLADFGAAGYAAVIYPCSVMRAQQYAARALAAALRRDGHTGAGPPMQTQAEELALARYEPGQEWHYPSPGWRDPESPEMPQAWEGWAQGETAQSSSSRLRYAGSWAVP